MPPEDEDVEVDLPGTPSLPRPAPQGPLDHLAGLEKGQRCAPRVASEADVHGGGRVQEQRLLSEADRIGLVEIRHGPDRQIGLGGEGRQGGQEHFLAIAEVRTQADVGPDPSWIGPRTTVA